MGLIFCILAFVGAYYGTRRSLGLGMSAVLIAGYLYGILRARYLDSFTHFIFDSGVLALYIAHFTRRGIEAPGHAVELFEWARSLILWPIIVFCLGVLYPQHILIQLVGLRAAIWFLPFLIVGVWTRPADLVWIARTLSVMNLVALVFALGEYVLGLEAFFPKNSVTELMYRSKDVAGFSAYRIPATFSSSAAYGSTMVTAMPWLIGRLVSPDSRFYERLLMGAGIMAGSLGIFLCGSRSPVVGLVFLGLFAGYLLRARIGSLSLLVVVGAVVAFFVSGSERLQRFMSLQDQELVTERLLHSANVSIIELLMEYPVGTGLGSAFGTSIPGFLSHLLVEQIGAENEYARIGLEQTIVGLSLWFAFLVWVLRRSPPKMTGGWLISVQLMWAYALMTWLTAFMGCGALMSIPGTPMVLFMMGILGRSRVPGVVKKSAPSPKPIKGAAWHPG